MKTKWLYLLIGIIVGIIVGIILSVIWLLYQPCEKQWDKPANVPISAVWKGGCDGGNWMELVDIKQDTIRLRIYRDWNGKLILDANFVYENCDSLQLTKTNWSDYISVFDGEKLYTVVVVNGHYCRLIPIFPAYYEEE